MTMKFKSKKLILIAGVFFLIATAAAVIKFMPDTSAPVAKALPKKNTAIVKNVFKGKAKGAETVLPEVIGYEENQEQREEREEADIQDTPEKAKIRASLEIDIKALSKKKEAETKEYTVLMKSFDDAISNSELPPEDLTRKKYELEAIKTMLTSAYDQKISSIDSSLKKKLEQYHELTRD